MRPLEASPTTIAIERLLLGAEADRVREAIDEARSAASDPRESAGLSFAEGALSLREGALVPAGEKLRAAAAELASAGDREASELAEIEASVADARRGMRDLAEAVRARMSVLEREGSTDRVKVSALVVHGTAERVLGDAALAQRAFLEAKDRADAFPELKTQALNSLGTLYVVTGALAAARSVLEPAAELCHARGDTVGEAIAMGQLGAVALGLGDLVLARKHLSRQEWLASRVGDLFGMTRALVWLADVALELGAPDDALDIGLRALAQAESAGLGTFKAYASRVVGRAKRQLGEDGSAYSEQALAIFKEQRLPLGEALATWDLALAKSEVDRPALDRAARSLASLGLVDRVVEVMSDLRDGDAGPVASGEWPLPDVPSLLMTASLSGRRAELLEMDLVHDDPEGLARSVGDKTSAKRNLARLGALTIDRPGLVALVVVGDGDPAAALSDRALSCALAGQVGQASLFVWPRTDDAAVIARDVATLVSAGRAGAMLESDRARVVAPGFGGATGARLEGIDSLGLLTQALAADRKQREVVLDATAAALEAALRASGIGVRVLGT